MLSTLHARENDPHDALEIAPDVVFAARADRPFPTLAPDALGYAADPQDHIASSADAPSLDATFRATATDNSHILREPSQARAWARRALIGFLFAIGSAFAAAAWQHYGDHAVAVVADWMPRFTLTSPSPSDPAGSASPSGLQAAAVTDASTPTAPAAQATDAGASQPPAAPDQMQLIQSMARDVATMAQQIEQLKTGIRELKAGQEQMSREMAKTAEARASEPIVRPRPTPPPHPAAIVPTRKPRPALSAAQTIPAPLPPTPAAPPPAPLQPAPAPQATTQPDGEPVVRPPMPLR
jgi:hypothetical protein